MTRYYAALFAGLLAFSACEGPPGPAGQDGQDGTNGTNGSNGTNGTDGTDAIDWGTVAGVLTIGTTTTPAVGVQVVATPGTNLVATSDATGAWELELPIGFYTLTIGEDPTDGYEKLVISNVVVGARTSQTFSKGLTRTNPLVVSAGTTQYQVGFGQQVQLNATVTGAPTGVTPTYAWTQTAGPLNPLSDATIANPTFTTLKIADVMAMSGTVSGKWIDLAPPLRHGVYPIASEQMNNQLAYTYKVTVTAGDFVSSSTVQIKSGNWSTGLTTMPVGHRVIVAAPTQASYSWTLLSQPGTGVTLDYPTEQFVSFVPNAEGDYVLRDGTKEVRVRAANYLGVGVTAGNLDACTAGCHGAAPLPAGYADAVTKWKTSGHANLFRLGIEGVASDHYGASCIRCHTTGYDPGATSGGFDDVAATAEYIFPVPQQAGRWAEVPSSVKKLATIGCENCHGPNSQHTQGTNTMEVSFASDACNTCHYDVGHHDRGYLHGFSRHSNLQLALDEGFSASCARCHAAQGYKLYVNALKAGATTITLPTTGMWTTDTVEPISCPACHDPHDGEIRLEENITLLPSGFGVAGVGKGALCMSCHNTRNGAHNDTLAFNDFRAPHAPSQADVLMGKNAYFVGGYQLSDHASATDTCVTCHMWNGTHVEGPGPGFHIGGTNHTFQANHSTCAQCHGDTVTGVALVEATHAALNELEDAIGAYAFKLLKAQVDDATALGFDVLLHNVATDVDATAYTKITAAEYPVDATSFTFLPEIHGRMSLCFTAKADITVTWTGSTTPSTTREVCQQVEKYLLTGTATKAFPTNSAFNKSLWNFYLLHGDNSGGVHNPSFTREVINASIAQIKAATAAMP